MIVTDEFGDIKLSYTINNNNAQEQNNTTDADKAELERLKLKNRILKAQIAEVQSQKRLEEENLAHAKQSTKNIIEGLNPEQKEYVVQKLIEQGNNEIANIIINYSASSQEAQDPNIMGQTQEYNQ